jgi:outer membrane protein TolC
MQIMKGLACAVLVMLLPFLAAAQEAAIPVITLQQSIDAAMAGGDDNKILQGTLDAARAQHALNVSRNSFTLSGLAGGQSGWLLNNPDPLASKILATTSGAQAGLTLAGPLTSVSVTPSYVPANPPGSPDPFTLVSVNASQTVWNGYWGGPTQAAVDKSLLNLRGKEIGTEASRLGITYAVKQAYYVLLSAQDNLQLKNRILDKQNAVLEQIQAVYDMKAASLADLKTAKLNARSAQVDVHSAAHDLRFARIALATLMGKDPDAEFSAADAAPPTVPVATLSDAILAGLIRRVELKQLALSLKSSSVDLALARGQATPTLSVTGAANGLLDLATSAQSGSISVGVKLSLPVLDAGAVDNQVKSILSQNAVYAIQETQLRKSITTAIRNAWEGVQLAGEKAEVARLSVEATDLQYQMVSAQRDAGTASNQDMLTAAVNLANAQNSLAGAVSAAELAVLQLQNVMGY